MVKRCYTNEKYCLSQNPIDEELLKDHIADSIMLLNKAKNILDRTIKNGNLTLDERKALIYASRYIVFAVEEIPDV